MSRSRGWCFTINNYTWDDEHWALTLHWVMEEGQQIAVKYVVCGKEVGEEGTPHLQGYLWFNSLKSLSQVKELHGTAHWEPAKADALKNKEYCTKEGDYFEYGTPPMSQGEKGEANEKRWDEARKAAEEGNWEDIPSDIYIKYVKNLEYIFKSKQPAVECIDGELVNEWMYGEPGGGKSGLALKENPGAYIKDMDQWWDGYVDQESVIIDDVDKFQKKWARELKLWGQHQPFSADVKGSKRILRPKKLVVTSNYKIDEIWEDEITRVAMHRRFKERFVVKNPADRLNPFVYSEEEVKALAHLTGPGCGGPAIKDRPSLFVNTFNKP